MLSLHIYLIPGHKLCLSCWDRIQEINGKEDSEEINDECNSDGIINLEQTFFLLEQRSYNVLEEMNVNPVKLHAVLHPVEAQQKQNFLKENNSKLKSSVADTFLINEDNLSDDKSFWH